MAIGVDRHRMADGGQQRCVIDTVRVGVALGQVDAVELRPLVGDGFLVNTGEGPLVITDIRITGEDAGDFRVSAAMPRRPGG